MDEKNRLILFELFQNSRLPISKIAKTLHLPEKTVNNRINRMIEQGTIKKFNVMVNYQKLGYLRYSLFLDLKDINDSKVQSKINEALKLKEVSCCYLLDELNEWKIYISIWSKNVDDYDLIQSKILCIFKEELVDFINFQSIRSYTYLSRIINPLKSAKCDVKNSSEQEEIDSLDWKIINILRTNSRETILEIAKKLRIHVETVKRRIKKLIKKDIIQRFYPLIDFDKIGIKEYTFIVRLDPSENKKIEEFITWARTNPHFVIITKTTGFVNLYYAFQVERKDQLKEIMSKINQKIGDITLKRYFVGVDRMLK